MMLMRTAFIVAAVALATGAAADPQLTPDVVAQRTECGKLGAAWVQQHPLPESNRNEAFAASIFYGSKTNQCWIIKVRTWGDGDYRDRHLIDAQTGIETMTCYDDPGKKPTNAKPKRDCDYIEKVEDATLASGFMAVPIPSQANAK